MMHVALGFFGRDAVQYLHLAHRAEGRDGHHLGFAARENGGAVRAGQNADFAPDGADILRQTKGGSTQYFDYDESGSPLRMEYGGAWYYSTSTMGRVRRNICVRR